MSNLSRIEETLEQLEDEAYSLNVELLRAKAVGADTRTINRQLESVLVRYADEAMSADAARALRQDLHAVRNMLTDEELADPDTALNGGTVGATW